MKFNIHLAQPRDLAGMALGMNTRVRIYDTKQRASTAPSAHSRGFVWFVSCPAWYSQLRKEGRKLIPLLDEPGLSLHAKSQSDLLGCLKQDPKPHHQLVCTLHSPFRVDPLLRNSVLWAGGRGAVGNIERIGFKMLQ